MRHDHHDPRCSDSMECRCHAIGGTCWRCGRPDPTNQGECSEPFILRAAVALVRREEKFLCVWNKRADGWSFPGGLVEPTTGAGRSSETCPHAVRRGLREETGLEARSVRLVYIGHTDTAKPGRASIVYLYEVEAPGEALPQEEGAPLTLLSEAEFLEQSPFAMFYARAFGALEERRRTLEHLAWLTKGRAPNDATEVVKVQTWNHAIANLTRAYHVKER